MRTLGFAALALFGAMPAAAADERPAMPGWMAGCWLQVEGERWAEECWTAPRAGLMLGSGRSGAGERVGSFEFMRIEAGENALTFHGGPQGANWTPFPGAPDADGGVTFLNVEHDYPQRVRYWREGALLKAEISKADGSDAMRWSYARMGG